MVPPLTLVLPVMDPLTPATVAEMVTLEAVPVAVTTPVPLTLAQPLELCQDAELVTSLLPESNAAIAFRVAVGAAEKLVPPVEVVTVTEFGWLTKNPRQPMPTAINTNTTRATTVSFRLQLRVYRDTSLVIGKDPPTLFHGSSEAANKF